MFDICSIPAYTASLRRIMHGINHSTRKTQTLAHNRLIHITGAYTTGAHKAVGGCRMTSAHRPLRICHWKPVAENPRRESLVRKMPSRQTSQTAEPAKFRAYRVWSQPSSMPTKFRASQPLPANQAPRQPDSHAATQNPPDPLHQHRPHRDPLHPDPQRPYRRRYPHLRHPQHPHQHQHQPRHRHRHRAHQARRRGADR